MSPRAIILAAGQGSRLGALTADRPKCMVELRGKPLLHHQIEAMERCGVCDITVVCGYLADKVDTLGHRKRLNPRFADTNMVATLFCVEDLMNDDLVISYGDIVYSDAVLDTLIATKGDVRVAVDMGWHAYWSRRYADPLEDAETLELDGATGRLLSLGRRPKRLDEVQGQYIGLTGYRGAGVAALRGAYHEAFAAGGDNAWGSGRTLEKAYMTDLIDHLCRMTTVMSAPIQRGWVEIDNATDLEVARVEAEAFLA